MSAAGIRAGRAYVELASEDSSLTSGLKKAQRMMDAFAKGSAIAGATLVGAGLAVLGGLAGLAGMATEMGSALKDASDRTGIAVESLSELEYAARMSDASLDDLIGGVFKLQKTLASVSPKKNPFAALGLSAEELKSMKPEDAFLRVADALADITNPTERNAAAMAVFGKGAGKLIPLLASGADGIGEMTGDFKRLNMQISATDAGELESFGDTVETIGMQVKHILFQVGAAVVVAVKPYATLLSDALGRVAGFVKEHRNLAVAAGLAAGGMVAVGSGMVALAVTATVTSTALGLVTKAMALMGVAGAAKGATGLIGKMLMGAVPALLAAGSGLLAIAPAAAVVVAALIPIGFVLADATNNFAFFREAGASAIGYVGNAFKAGAKLVSETVGGIADALATADIGLAGQIAMAGLNVAFQAGKGEVLKVWSSLTSSMLKMWASASSEVLSMWNAIVGQISGASVGLFLDDDELAARAEKIRNGAKTLFDKANQADAAGDTQQADVHRKSANQLLKSAKQEDPEAAKAAAQQLAQDATIDAQDKITKALNDRLAALEKDDGSGVSDAQKKLDEATAKLAVLRAKAAQERADSNKPDAPPSPKPDFSREAPTPDVDLKKFAPKVVGGFSNAQIGAQSNVLGLLDPMKKTAANTEAMRESLDRIADNTQPDPDEDDGELYE